MKYSYSQIGLLAELLEDEIAGRPLNHDLIEKYAAELADIFPTVASSLSRIIQRSRAIRQGLVPEPW